MKIRGTGLLIICGMLLGVAASGENLLVNGDFELDTRAQAKWGFATWSSKPSRATLEWSTDAHSGEHAARITGVANAGEERVRGVLISTPVDVQEGMYTLKGWYKTGGEASAHLQIEVYAEAYVSSKTPTMDKTYRKLDQTADWTPFAFDLNLKRGATQVVLLLRATGIGDVFFDDVSFSRVTDPLVVHLFAAEFGRNHTMPLIPGAPNFCRLMLSGDRAAIEGDVEVILDLPRGVDTFGLLDPGEEIERDGFPYTRLRVPISDETLAGLKPGVSHCAVTVWLDATDLTEDGNMYYRAVVGGEEMPEKQAQVRVLPPLPEGPRPANYQGFFCWGLFRGVPEKLWPDVYEMVRGMGVNTLLASEEPTGWREYLQKRLRADGGHLWANVPYAYIRPMTKRGWETRIIADPDAFFGLDEGYYARMAPRIDGVFWDWEPANALKNPLWDDPATVAAFAEREGLNAATLTEDRLKGELREEFLAFRTWQLGEVMRLWAKFVHDLRPDLTIAICQGSGMPPDRYVDYKAYDDIPNLVDLPMIYTGSVMGFARSVEGMREYLPDAKIIPMTCTGMLADAHWLASKTPRAIYFDYVSSALQGCAGCSHWPDLSRGFDMEYVWEVSRAMRDLGTVEDFLQGGEADPEAVSVTPLPEVETAIETGAGEVKLVSPQWDKLALWYAHRLGDDTLVSVCNMHLDKPATVQVRIADAKGAGWFLYDPVTHAVLVPDGAQTWSAAQLASGVLYEVPTSSLGMLVASVSAPEGGFTDDVRESDVRKRFEARQAEAAAEGDIAVMHEGNLEISWADMDGDGNAEVRLASRHQELGIGPSGNLWSWKVQGQEQDLVSRFDDGGACVDRFWWPEGARAANEGSSEYELVLREIAGGQAVVMFRRALTHWALGGLVLEKSYAIRDDRPGVQVRVTLRNESPEVIEFSYWSHNCFLAGPTPTLELATTAGDQVFGGEDQPREIWAAAANVPADQRDLLNSKCSLTLAGPSFALADPSGGRIQITTAPSLLQLYRWWDGTDNGRYTVEWMYQRQKLVTGASWSTSFQLGWE
jgi:hypothetical protein